MDHIVDVYGEIHTKEDRDRIEKLILDNHGSSPYDFILTEEAGGYSGFNKKELEDLIERNVYSISPRSYKLGMALDIPVIGIDDWDDDTYKDDIKDKNGMAIDFKRSFLIREKQMVKKIKEYMAKGRVAVIVGDTHLRLSSSKELGPMSYIRKAFRSNKNVIFHRSPNKEIY